MTFNIQNISQMSSLRWELAENLSENAPEEYLETLFRSFLQGIEENLDVSFSQNIQKKIWSSTTFERLEKTKSAFTDDVRQNILKSFKDKEIKEILEGRKQKKMDPHYKDRLNQEYKKASSSIIAHLQFNIEAFKHKWSEEIENQAQRWKLAQKLSYDSTTKTMRLLFNDLLENIEKDLRKSFDQSHKETIWISAYSKVETIQEAFTHIIHDKALYVFNDHTIKDIIKIYSDTKYKQFQLPIVLELYQLRQSQKPLNPLIFEINKIKEEWIFDINRMAKSQK